MQTDFIKSSAPEAWDLQGTGSAAGAGGGSSSAGSAVNTQDTAQNFAGFIDIGSGFEGGNVLFRNSGYLRLGQGDNSVIFDANDALYRVAVGSETYAIAPFRVQKDGKFHAGSSSQYIDWDGTKLTIAGDVVQIDTSTGAVKGSLQNVISLTAGETISGATTPVAVYMAKTQESTAIENSIIIGSPLGNSNVTTTAWIAQTFTTSSSVNYLKGVYVYLDDNVLNATATIYLYATNVGTGKPTGAALVTKTQVLNGSDKPMPYWIDLDYDCSVSTQYAIVIKASAATVHAPYVSDATISNGTGWTSTDSGSTWTALSNDYEMCIMGCAKKTLGRVFSCDGNNAFKLGFNGFAITTGNAGDTITVQTDGVVSGFTGLTTGKKYYVDDSGVLSTTKGTYRCLVGFAISTTQLMIQKDLSLIFLEKYESLSTQIAQFRTNVWEPRVLFNLPETSVQAQFRFSDAASGSQSFGVRSFDSSDSVSYEINSAGDGTSVSPIIQLNKNRMFKTNCITGQVPTQSQLICAWIDPYYGD